MNIEVDVVTEDVWRTTIHVDDDAIRVYSDGDTEVWRLPPFGSMFGEMFPAYQVTHGIGTPPRMVFKIRETAAMVADLQD